LKGKYTNPIKYSLAKTQRAAMRLVLRRLAAWRPLENPEAGYTAIIGCNGQLAAMIGADLKMLSCQDRENLKNIVIVIDRPKSEITFPVEQSMRDKYPELPLQFAYYSPTQTRILNAIGWGWAYAWLSWSTGIALTKTRYALLQDFDAILINPDALEQRYGAIVERGDQYLGDRWYSGCGVELDDRLVMTPELMFDAVHVRNHHRPIDLFNHVTIHHGRTVDFDTFLYAQSKAGKKSVLPIAEEDMVHPSQMICQFTHLMAGRGTLAPDRNNLLLVPYFMYVGGEQATLAQQHSLLRACDGKTVPFFGKPLEIGQLTQPHRAWMRKQAYRLEIAFHGAVRHDVEAYFDTLDHVVVQKTPVAVTI
jgi:hypothetical protein